MKAAVTLSPARSEAKHADEEAIAGTAATHTGNRQQYEP